MFFRNKKQMMAAIAIGVALCGLPTHSHAQTTTIDGGVLGEYAKKIAKYTEQLQKMEKITQTATDVLNTEQHLQNTIGELGSNVSYIRGMSLSGTMESLNMGIYNGVSQGANMLVGRAENSLSTSLTNQISAIEQSAALEQQDMIQKTGNDVTDSHISAINTVLHGTMNVANSAQALTNNLFLADITPTGEAMEAMNAVRRALYQGAIIANLGQSDAYTQDVVEKDSKATETLDSDRDATKVLRGRIQNNTEALAKIVNIEQSGTVLYGKYLQLETAQSLSKLPVQSYTTNDGPASLN